MSLLGGILCYVGFQIGYNYLAIRLPKRNSIEGIHAKHRSYMNKKSVVDNETNWGAFNEGWDACIEYMNDKVK